MKQMFESLRSIPWIQICISVIIFILGLFAQPILETRIEPFFSSANIPLTIFILTSILFAVNIAIWNHTRRQINSLTQYTQLLARYVGHRVRILSYFEGYEEVRKRTQSASFEVLKLIYYELESGNPAYGDNILQSPARRNLYLQEQEKIQQERGKDNLRYIEIVQIPENYNVEDIIKSDLIYRESCEFLANISRQEPEFVSLRVSEIVFPNTVIIIDRAFLYIAFQTKNPDTGLCEYPFLGIVIEDPSSEVVRDMLKLYHRIEANSKPITNIPPIKPTKA